MKKGILLTAILLAGTFGLKAQALSPQVVASAGDHYSNSSGQLSWTAGESVVETFSAGGYILTQGFQQPVNLFTTATHQANAWAEVKAYPNPTYNILDLYLPQGKHGQVKVEIFDVAGKVLYAETLASQDGVVKVDLSAYENGLYLLKLGSIFGSDQTILRIQKIN